MLSKTKRTIAAAIFPLSAMLAVAAHADDATEARLRDALRTTTEQLHRLEAENAALQEKQAAAPAAAEKPAAKKESAASSRTIADLRRRLEAAEQEAEKAKAAYAGVVSASEKKDADAAKKLADLSADRDQLAVCRSKNAALLKTAKEILDRYEDVGFGDVLGRKEPFTGIKRVELQNIEQDTRDTLRANTVSP